MVWCRFIFVCILLFRFIQSMYVICDDITIRRIEKWTILNDTKISIFFFFFHWVWVIYRSDLANQNFIKFNDVRVRDECVSHQTLDKSMKSIQNDQIEYWMFYFRSSWLEAERKILNDIINGDSPFRFIAKWHNVQIRNKICLSLVSSMVRITCS